MIKNICTQWREVILKFNNKLFVQNNSSAVEIFCGYSVITTSIFFRIKFSKRKVLFVQVYFY